MILKPHVKCNSEVVRLDVGMDIQEALEDAYSNSGLREQLSYAVPTKEPICITSK